MSKDRITIANLVQHVVRRRQVGETLTTTQLNNEVKVLADEFEVTMSFGYKPKTEIVDMACVGVQHEGSPGRIFRKDPNVYIRKANANDDVCLSGSNGVCYYAKGGHSSNGCVIRENRSLKKP